MKVAKHLLRNVIFVSLLRKNYYSNLDIKDITDNKNFWKSVKPLFFDKTKSTFSVTLKDNNKIVESQITLATFLTIDFKNFIFAPN